MPNESEFITKVEKRAGHVQDFDSDRIRNAILKAFAETSEGSELEADKITTTIVKKIDDRIKKDAE